MTEPGDLGAAVATLMGSSGPLARHDPDYRERTQQCAMAQAVARAIQGPHTLVVEAGTGVGKTYAYLIPLLLSGRRSLVSTATKSLQDQLYWRDLPGLCQRLGLPLSTALLKGRGSYLCRHRMAQARHLPEGLDRSSQRLLARVEDWARSSTTGDLSEVPGLDERSALMPLITSTRDNCLGGECPAVGECHVMKARRQAMSADLVVVNHHLFFADLALKETGMAELLPSVEVVVFDEAHQILDTGLQFVASSVGTLAIMDLSRDLRVAGLAHARGLQDWLGCTQALEQAAGELLLACAGGDREGEDGGDGQGQGVTARAARGRRRIPWAERCSGRGESQARPVEVAFSQALHALADRLEAARSCADSVAERHPELERLVLRAQALRQCVMHFQSPVAVDRVRWIDLGTNQARLIDTPLDIRALMQQSREQTHRAWVFTSATLGHEPTLAWFRAQAGLEDAQVLCVGSPYDYATQARIWLPTQLPLPGQAGHNEAVSKVAAQCAARLGGRTFVLVTTLRALSIISHQIRSLFESRGLRIEVLVQGSEPKRTLLERFLHACGRHGAVLVGAASFWEGIDVPGCALQCVVIDKLPFPPPDDPLLEARTRALKAQGRDPFAELFLAEAAIALKQGVGRLIRTETDRGLLVLCDKRLQTKPYGKRLLDALPPMARAADGAAVAEWLATLRAGV